MSWIKQHFHKLMLFIIVAALLFIALHCGPQALSAETDRSLPSVGLYLPIGNEAEGKKAFLKFKCYSCHRVQFDSELPAPVAAEPGPVLGDFRRLLVPGEFADAILSPSRHKTKGFETAGISRMGEFGNTMTVQELVDIVAYLMAQEE